MALEFTTTAVENEIEVNPKGASSRRFNRRGKLTTKERMFFFEQLALLLETGSSLLPALLVIKKQAQSPALVSLLERVAQDIESGRSFSQALSLHPTIFPSTYVNLVAASEGGGFLHGVLLQLLDMEEKREQLQSTVKSALSYPVFLMLFSVAVVVFVLVVVFPKFADMFAEIKDQLPTTTLFLMWLSDMLRIYWIPIVFGLIVSVGAFAKWLTVEHGQMAMDRLKLSFPGLKQIFTEIYFIQSLKVMSMSLANGVTVVDTLAGTKEVVKNHLIRNFFARTEEGVQQGKGLAHGFQSDPLVPELVRQMVTTGEESGTLPHVMGRLASYYERELTKRLTLLSKIAEPLMLLVMGLVVGILVSSLILPIFKLSKAVT